jgi:hypothetical protein
MYKKYYISNSPSFHGLNYDKVWDTLISYFVQLDIDEITIVDTILKKEIEIDQQFLDKVDFNGEKPTKIYISLNPFMVNNGELHICRTYNINPNVFSQLEKEWLNNLKEELVLQDFIVSVDGQKYFWHNYDSVVALLYPKELELFNSLGFELKEWNIKLNDVI